MGEDTNPFLYNRKCAYVFRKTKLPERGKESVYFFNSPFFLLLSCAILPARKVSACDRRAGIRTGRK